MPERRSYPTPRVASAQLSLTEAPVSEAVLQFAWAQRRYRAEGLMTTTGEPVMVVHPGRLNTEQGPDFMGAHVRIGGVDLHGAVELHLNSRGWTEHGHHTDAGYNAVVLHVVLQPASGPAPRRADGTTLPELSLGGRLDPDLLARHAELVQSPARVPCARLIHRVPGFEVRRWVQRQGVARVAAKAEAIAQRAGGAIADWPHQLLIELAGGFGGPQNGEGFRQLAAALPLRVLQRHADDPVATEALLFGLGGMLSGLPLDDYHARLIDTWAYLQGLHKLSMPTLPPWHYLRMRPAAFPSLRLAQLAAVLHRHAVQQHGLNLVALIDSTAQRLDHWLDAEPTPYWATHYRLGHPTTRRAKHPGAQLRQHLLINVLVPFAYLYHRARGDASAAERAIDWLTELEPEHNSVIAPLVNAGVHPRDALDSQGLLQLVKSYCTPRRCLACAIGHQLLKPELPPQRP